MAYCNQTLAGIQLDCTNSMGGIKRVYIANYGDVESVTVGADGEITAIAMNGSAKFKTYQFRKQTGSLTSTLNVDETTGLNYVSSELSLVFTKQETSKRLEIAALSIGQLAVIVEDCNGLFQYLGKDDYVSASAGGSTSGTSKGDQNAYNLTLKDESISYPHFVTSEAVKAVVA